jgi:hypothetical protein
MMLGVMDSVLLFPDHPELRLYRLAPQQVKADFLAQVQLRWLLRTLTWTLRGHVMNWKLQIDTAKVVVGEPVLQPTTESLSVDEVLLHWAETRQRMAEEDKQLSEEQIDYRTRISLNAFWVGHQEHYSFTLNSRSGKHLMTIGTPAYSNGGGGFLFYK